MVTKSKLEELIKIVDISNKETHNEISHGIQEAAEFIVELSKVEMDKMRPDKFKEEFSDLFFQQLRILRRINWTLDDLIDSCMNKTRVRFPHQLD